MKRPDLPSGMTAEQYALIHIAAGRAAQSQFPKEILDVARGVVDRMKAEGLLDPPVKGPIHG